MALFFSPLNFAMFAMLLLVHFSQYQHSGKSFGKGCNPPTRRIASNLGENPIQHDKFPNTKGQTQVPKYIRANQVPNTTGHAIGKTNTTRMITILNNTMWHNPRKNTTQCGITHEGMTQKSRQKPGNSKSPIQPGMAPGQKYIPTFSPTQNRNSFIHNVHQHKYEPALSIPTAKYTSKYPPHRHLEITKRNKHQYEILVNIHRKNHTEEPLNRRLYLGTKIIGTLTQLESAMKQPSNQDSDKASQKYQKYLLE